MMLTDEQIGVIAIEHGMGGYFRKSMSASDLVSFARAVERALQPQWSDQPPTEAGWYWYRKGEGWPASLCDVIKHTREEVPRAHWNTGLSQSIESLDGQWAGPITPPEE